MSKTEILSENNSNKPSNNLQMDDIYPKITTELPTIFYQKNNRIMKPEEILMGLILPTVSNRLKYQIEVRKLKKSTDYSG